jgi:hypothetical protein
MLNLSPEANKWFHPLQSFLDSSFALAMPAMEML